MNTLTSQVFLAFRQDVITENKMSEIINPAWPKTPEGLTDWEFLKPLLCFADFAGSCSPSSKRMHYDSHSTAVHL